MKTINQRVKNYRKARSLSQAQVAEMLDMKSSTYSQYERRGNITCERLIKLSEILNVSCNTLLFGEMSEPAPLPVPKPEKSDFTNREKMLISALRIMPAKKRDSIYKITALTKMKQFDPTFILNE